MIDYDVGVILPTAGNGERMGGCHPKQYFEIMGRPLLLYALQEFLQPDWIKQVVLVVDNPERVKNLLDTEIRRGNAIEKVIVVQGGTTRHRSIKTGLQTLRKSNSEIRVVIVHDGVRPLVPISFVENLVKAADKHGAAGSVRPLVSTILKADENEFLEQSLDRSQHLASETPQAFLMDTLNTAYSKCCDEDLDHGTECLQLAIKYAGIRAKLLSGPEDLWKVTYKKDVYAAVGCLKEYGTKVCIVAAHEPDAAQLLLETLTPKVHTISKALTSNNIATQTSQAIFNTVVFFHVREIDQNGQLLDLASVLDVDKQGLIIHVIEHPATPDQNDGMRNLSALELHQSGRHMARHYEKLHKAVVVIHWLCSGEDERLAELLASLILCDKPYVFSGQTLFL